MTATPIPRTLVLTYFGDMDVSELREKPAGRQPIDTRTIPLDRGLTEMVEAVGRAIARRPAGLLGLSAGRGIGDQRSRCGGGSVRELESSVSATASGLVHGRMKGTDKDAAMAALRGRRDTAARRDHGDRSRRRRAGSHRDGDRTCRALRAGAAAPAARTHRPRHRPLRPVFCSTRHRSAKPQRRVLRSCARPRTAFASPRKI